MGTNGGAYDAKRFRRGRGIFGRDFAASDDSGSVRVVAGALSAAAGVSVALLLFVNDELNDGAGVTLLNRSLEVWSCEEVVCWNSEDAVAGFCAVGSAVLNNPNGVDEDVVGGAVAAVEPAPNIELVVVCGCEAFGALALL